MNSKLIKKILETAKIENSAVANLISFLPEEQHESALDILFETATSIPVANKSKIITKNKIKRTMTVQSENPLTRTVVVDISEEAYVKDETDLALFIKGEEVEVESVYSGIFPRLAKRTSSMEITIQQWMEDSAMRY